MRIDVYLDDATEPLTTLTPPARFELDSTRLDDGEHRLRFRALDEHGAAGERVVPVHVRNGPALDVHGVADGDRLTGRVPILVNAYGAKVGDDFEPVRIETPAPVPTWAWVLCLTIMGWAVGYVAFEATDRARDVDRVAAVSSEGNGGALPAPQALGAQLYGNYCASCHMPAGTGVAGVFPPLKGNPAVLADDPAEHIRAILHGVSGKVIDGVAYPAPMPPFGGQLSDEEVAAVVNHERTAWGNQAATIGAADVAGHR
ncbi:MAG: cytochrome c [Pseudomonadota bacterium]